MTNTIFLIRHGQTLENANRTIQLPEASLSPTGVSQARLLAERLAGEGITRIVSSDLTRATETAERLSRATGAEVDLEPLLQERNFGEIRGTHYDDLGFDLFAPAYFPAGGETWGEFHARVDHAVAVVERVAAALAGPLAVVTHGLVCHSIAERHLVLPDGEVSPTAWNNTSVTIIERPAPWRARLLNCASHLVASEKVGEAPV